VFALERDMAPHRLEQRPHHEAQSLGIRDRATVPDMQQRFGHLLRK